MVAIYFDHSATTPVDEEVQQTWQEVTARYFGNPSSLHRLGLESEHLLHRAREVVLKYMGAEDMEVIFTSGGTESNNLAIKGAAFGYAKRGKHLITSQVEHSSVFDAFRALQEHFGFEVTFLPVDREGRVRPDDVAKAIRGDTVLVSVMLVNNELGTIQPVREIGNLLRQHPKILLHVDAVQAVGKVPVHFEQHAIDLLSISGHKMHAPKGTGALLVRKGIELFPLHHGGHQEHGMRSGTENVPGIVAMAKAVRLLMEHMEQNVAHIRTLKSAMVDGLKRLDGVAFNHPESACAPHILNVSFPGVKAEVLLHALEEEQIYVSTRSACSSRRRTVSRILESAGLDQERMDSAIRISFSQRNTMEEVDRFLDTLARVLPKLQRVMNA